MTSVRDRERLRAAPRTLAGRRVAIGEEGGLDATVAALRRLLVNHGAVVTTHHHPDGSIQASEANAGGAEVYIGLRLDSDDRHCSTAYYAGYRYSSPGGRRLAELLQASAVTVPRPPRRGQPGHVAPAAPGDPDAGGHRARSGRPRVVVEQAAAIARAVVDGAGRMGGQRLGLGATTLDRRPPPDTDSRDV